MIKLCSFQNKDKTKDQIRREKEKEKEEKRKKKEEEKRQKEQQKQRRKVKGRPGLMSQNSTPWGTVEDQRQSEDQLVPLFVEKCVEFIEAEGLSVEGLYRVPGNRAQVEMLIDKYVEGEQILICCIFIFNYTECITWLIKNVFRLNCKMEWYYFVLLASCIKDRFLGGLRVTNPTIRLMISVCPSVRPSVRFWLFDGPHFVNSISTKTTALTSQCVMSMN